MLKTGDMFASLGAILDATPHAYAILDRDHTIRAVSAAYLDMTSSTLDDLIGRSIYEAFPDNPADPSGTPQMLRDSLNRVHATGTPEELEFRHPIPVRDAPGTFANHWWRVVNTALRENDRTIGILHHGVNVTEAVLARRTADIHRRTADHLSGLAFWEFEPSTGTAIASAALARMFGLPDMEGRVDPVPFFDRLINGDDERLMADFAALEDGDIGTVIEGEYQLDVPGHGERWVHIRGELTRVNPYDPAYFVGMAMDITGAKTREDDLAQALIERDRLLDQTDILLSEVNHRIKNSLQIVSSILKIDARHAAGEEARQRLHNAANRVQAVASVHELIYKAGQVTTVEMGDYLRALCASLDDSSPGRVACRADRARLSTDRAISLALLVNELVSNAIEHGLDGGGDGTVAVALTRKDDRLLLTVEDDGAGKPQDAAPGLGTQIMAAMIAQIDAEMQEGPAENPPPHGSKPGHRVLVIIPLDD